MGLNVAGSRGGRCKQNLGCGLRILSPSGTGHTFRKLPGPWHLALGTLSKSGCGVRGLSINQSIANPCKVKGRGDGERSRTGVP